MTKSALKGRRILVVEDEYMLADELRTQLSDAGAVVLGPVPSVEQAIALIRQLDKIDWAILDINLGGEFAYPVADLLMDRNTPFVFSTGYVDAALPPRFADIPRCEKPINVDAVAQALG
ncbi:CheY chemotaxis protein or a CheY-like REC (receiver) domain [Rhizobium sp. NFR07]|uniref:response regulator n=1 Tax=Rhizobium sp. NFR07 TaxID=1566262 RepID=UPI0008E13E15|nr:response regulator [Rhizobium sp. NFR07]SFB59108.1 CheY chemotaxis protein or a CheY-like REC (receiver) domain [Rhizobium sp. NFR07]